MGKQIQINLTKEDEELLFKSMSTKFSIDVVDSEYSDDWDRNTLTRSNDSKKWVIIDTRVRSILIDNAVQMYAPQSGNYCGWKIMSKANSCIEFCRDLYSSGKVPSQGRMYVDTSTNFIGEEVSLAIGNDVQRCYDFACRWIRKNCSNLSTGNRVVWTSNEKIAEL